MRLFLKSLVCDVYYILFFTFTFPVWFTLVLVRRSWRAGFFQRLGFIPIGNPEKPRLWIHGVSVGEVLAARSLIRALASDPRFEIVLSVTTRTGFEVARKNFPKTPLFHFPLDVSFLVRKVLRRVAPSLVIMVELEVWPNFLLNARRMAVPFTFVNGRITRRSAESYPVIAWLLAPLFRETALFCVQNEEYASRLLHLGARGEHIRITGNLKYDNLPTAPPEGNASPLLGELAVEEGETVILGGSIHPGEEEALVESFLRLSGRHKGLRLILAPRHPERFDRAEEVVRNAGLSCHRRTQGVPKGGEKPVILLDTMGELASVYAVADIVFVGGSLVPHGGQNMMEPAAFGKPVIFGPHVHNFREDAALLKEQDAAVQIGERSELTGALEALIENPDEAVQRGKKGALAVARRRGATAKTLDALETVYLKPLSSSP
ncbi:MAG: 3-deoxy-D-manno-octulosonic acid transferase [Planctomycetota bacterium]